MRVVVVDDHACFRRLAARMLVEAGFLVVGEATDGEGGLREVERLFHWTAALPDETLTVESAVSLKNKTVTPIEGGMGRYAGARGTVTRTDRGPNGTLVTVRYER